VAVPAAPGRTPFREQYPEAVAARASDVAVLEPGVERWDVYRDRVAHAASSDDAWVDDQTLPRAVLGPDGRYLDANEAAAELFGVAPDQIIGRAIGTFRIEFVVRDSGKEATS